LRSFNDSLRLYMWQSHRPGMEEVFPFWKIHGDGGSGWVKFCEENLWLWYQPQKRDFGQQRN
jgi:hypothetical protein